jgi:hypothetical protein
MPACSGKAQRLERAGQLLLLLGAPLPTKGLTFFWRLVLAAFFLSCLACGGSRGATQ